MVEMVSNTVFNLSSDFSPYSFATTMRTFYASNKSKSVEGSDESGISIQSFNSDQSNNSRRESFNDNNVNYKRFSDTIITTNSSNYYTPKLQLTTLITENNNNNSNSSLSCSTQLSTPLTNGFISQEHHMQTTNDQQLSQQQIQFGQCRKPSTKSSKKHCHSLGLGLFRPASEIINDKNNNLLNSNLDEFNCQNSSNESSNSSEDEIVFDMFALCSANQQQLSLNSSQNQNNQQTTTTIYTSCNQSSKAVSKPTPCKRCGSNSSLSSFTSSLSSSLSSALNNSTSHNFGNLSNSLTENNFHNNYNKSQPDILITNLSHSLNQTFNNNNLTSTFVHYNRSRHNSINNLSNCLASINANNLNTGQPTIQPGDLVEIDRTLYVHWAIYIGNGEIVHIVDEKNDQDIPAGEFGLIKRDFLVNVAGNSFVRVNNKEVPAKERGLTSIKSEIVIKNILKLVGKRIPYNIITRNNEHYITEWKYGTGWSDQAKVTLSAMKSLRKDVSSNHASYINTLNSVLKSPGAYSPSSPSLIRSYSLSTSSNKNQKNNKLKMK